MTKYTRFYLTKWKPEGDSMVCRLMEREGSDDGTDAIVAEFAMDPGPLGEQLAEASLVMANAFADQQARNQGDAERLAELRAATVVQPAWTVA